MLQSLPQLSHSIGENTSVSEKLRSSNWRAFLLGQSGETVSFKYQLLLTWYRYRVNGKAYTQEANHSPLAFSVQQPGEFKITSIAQQQKMCKSMVTDLSYVVHPLPTAQVGHGNRIFQDIHEGKLMPLGRGLNTYAYRDPTGDQAEIKFTLIGEPPFSFTYQRSELSPKKGGKPGKVLETHTVSGITTTEYSIFSALEGLHELYIIDPDTA
jgi:nucleoporin POM152